MPEGVPRVTQIGMNLRVLAAAATLSVDTESVAIACGHPANTQSPFTQSAVP